MEESDERAAARRANIKRAALTVTLATIVAGTAIGCGNDPLPELSPTQTATATVPPGERDQLAGLAAAAKDKRYVATYALSTNARPRRTVTVAVATDGSWVVAVAGGALSGLADVAMFHSAAGTFQCALGPAAGAVGARPDLGTITPGCVAVPKLTATNDPQVQHIFTDWIDALVDRATALSVAAAPALPGARGTCFSVESTAAALAPPVDPGIYCYNPDGVLSAAKVSYGTLTLAGAVAPAPPSVTMPGPVVTRPLLPITAPRAPQSSRVVRSHRAIHRTMYL